MSRFAIADLHGCLQTFEALLDAISFSREDELFLLGDFVDRGADSKGVIDYIFHLQDLGYRIFCLRGNHDQMVLDALTKPNAHKTWLASGGAETLASFGVTHARELPERYIAFIEDLPHFLETDGYILVHAGLNFRYKNPLSDPDAMLWIRNWYAQVDREWLNGRIILHGHTPLFRHEIQQQVQALDKNGYLGLDNGCVYTDRAYLDMGLGSLCAFNLDDRSLTYVANQEKPAANALRPKSRLASLLSLFSF